MELLEIAGLSTSFTTRSGVIKAVDNVSFSLRKGRVLGLVGESGCGKTMTALSILNLVPPPGRITAGKIMFEGRDLLTLSGAGDAEGAGRAHLHGLSGAHDRAEPGVHRGEPDRRGPHHPPGRHVDHEALDRSVELLRSVGIPSPEKRVHEYPHQLSGGMRQRVMIAMAIACRPSLILADEPTTALDVTIQAHILELLTRIQAEMGMAMVLVTHDLGLIAERANEVAVMYAGRIVEQAETRELFSDPLHPYTRGLMASIPRPGDSRRGRLRTIAGTVPRLSDLPKGCTFSPRCDIRTGQCDTEPDLVEVRPGHKVRCWNWKAK